MDTLPTKYQTILSLFYFQELSHEEIGEVTQLPIGTIKTHLFRARSLLQQRLQKELQMEKAV
jgi:RNA polymerase sigma-70 factor (ECF subfamily)